MKYLELNELVVGEYYICIPYDNRSFNMKLKYSGEGIFISETTHEEFSVYGEIRYVISKA